MDVTLQEDGEICAFSDFHFRLFCKIYNVKTNNEYSEKHDYKNGTIYFYSEKFIDFITSEIKLNPISVIDELKSNDNTKERTFFSSALLLVGMTGVEPA